MQSILFMAGAAEQHRARRIHPDICQEPGWDWGVYKRAQCPVWEHYLHWGRSAAVQSHWERLTACTIVAMHASSCMCYWAINICTLQASYVCNLPVSTVSAAAVSRHEEDKQPGGIRGVVQPAQLPGGYW